MPVLDPQYISSWYIMSDTNNLSNYRLFESWKEKQSQDVKPRKLLQADIGTHVMDIGGIKWETQVASPVVLLSNIADNSHTVTGAFDLLIETFAVIQSPQLQTLLYQASSNPPAPVERPREAYPPAPTVYGLLKNANLNFSEQGTTCDLTFWSDKGGLFRPIAGPSPYDFIGRTAVFYDTRLILSDSLVNSPTLYQIKEGSISVDVDIQENYFVNARDQRPWFAIQGYHVRGSVKVVAVPNDPYLVIPYQDSGVFDVVSFGNTGLSIGDAQISFGTSQVNGEIERSLAQGQLSTINLTFECFTRYVV